MTEKKKRLVKFVGKCLYAQVYPGQERAPHPDQIETNPKAAEDRHYQISVECSKQLYDKLMAAGLSRMTLLKEVEGRTYINVKGSHTVMNKTTGQIYRFTDPVVTDNEDNALTIDTLIGNGSDVEVIAELADSKRCKVLRLQSVKVLNLVPYVKQDVLGEIELEEDNNNLTAKVPPTGESFF